MKRSWLWLCLQARSSLVYNNRIGPASDAVVVYYPERGNVMYGTVASFRIKRGAEQHLERELREFEEAGVPGAIGMLVYRMDADPQECYMVVVFSDKAAYFANAQSAEQDRRYQRLLSFMEGPPIWHDGEIAAVEGFRSANWKGSAS
jgi:quinol monooxygenase YgiN